MSESSSSEQNLKRGSEVRTGPEPRKNPGGDADGSEGGGGGAGAKWFRLMIPMVILAAGTLGFLKLSVEKEKPKAPPGKKQLIRTRVQEIRLTNFPVVVKTHGVVRPHSEVSLTAQVPGKIARIHPGLEDGAFFKSGEILLELESEDYETAVVAAEAQVARAGAAHALEETRARQARLNWEDLGYKEEPNELVLRLPQLREAKANVDSARAQLERSKRDLDRTKVRAPFNGRVRRKNVGPGQVVGAGTSLALVFASDFAEVRLPIAGREIQFLKLPETAGDAPLEVELRSSLGEGGEAAWKGWIIRTEGVLDENSLELFAITRVDDPFGLNSGKPPLRIGQPVVAAITGKTLDGVVALPRLAVRQMDQVLLVDPKELTLRTRTIVPIWSSEEFILVRDPEFREGGLFSTTHLVYAPNGAKVEIIPEVSVPLAAVGTNSPAGNAVRVQ